MTLRLTPSQYAAIRQPRPAPRETRPRKQPRREEAALQRAVLKALAGLGIWHERRNAGVLVVGRRRIKLGRPGTPDVMILHEGRAIFLELKSPEGRLRPSQRAWADGATAAGACVVVIRSLADLLAVLKAEGVTG